MKRKIILSIVALLTLSTTFAQVPRLRTQWGVFGGINTANYSISDSKADIENKLGWQVGITTALDFGLFAIEPQIMYVRQGMSLNSEGNNNYDIKSSSIDVPVLFSLRLFKPIRINAGPVFTVMNDAKQKSGDDLLAVGRVRPTMSYTVGASVAILQHLLLDVRYNGQFNSKKGFAIGSEQFDIDSYNVAISVGYLF